MMRVCDVSVSWRSAAAPRRHVITARGGERRGGSGGAGTQRFTPPERLLSAAPGAEQVGTLISVVLPCWRACCGVNSRACHLEPLFMLPTRTASHLQLLSQHLVPSLPLPGPQGHRVHTAPIHGAAARGRSDRPYRRRAGGEAVMRLKIVEALAWSRLRPPSQQAACLQVFACRLVVPRIPASKLFTS